VTSIEDRTFWANAGFDPLGIISAAVDTISGNARGASTITQQLVRNRLLPASAFTTTYERKIREIIQSIRLTQAFPGEEGKKQIMAAYLNDNFFGNNSYGIAAAARGYWGVTLDKLTLAQAAILAAMLQSPRPTTSSATRSRRTCRTAPPGWSSRSTLPSCCAATGSSSS
jgi:membrane peptidoglycan carboxypeptidase